MIEIEYALVQGGPDPDNCASREHFDELAEAEEAAEWRLAPTLWARTVTYGRWQRVRD